jgi:hypothetical protein
MTVLMTDFSGRWPHEVHGEFGCFHNCRQIARIGDGIGAFAAVALAAFAVAAFVVLTAVLAAFCSGVSLRLTVDFLADLAARRPPGSVNRC